MHNFYFRYLVWQIQDLTRNIEGDSVKMMMMMYLQEWKINFLHNRFLQHIQIYFQHSGQCRLNGQVHCHGEFAKM